MSILSDSFKVFCVLLGVCVLSACNSRPPYFKQLIEFHTDCNGGGTALLLLDPDPEPDIRNVVVLQQESYSNDQNTLINSADTPGRYSINIHLANEIQCTITPVDEFTRDCHNPGSIVPICHSSFKIIQYLKPTINPDKYPVPEIPEDIEN